MAYQGKSKSSHGMKRVRQIQRNRSNRAKSIDAGLKAPIAKTPEQWIANPNRYDLPNMDAPKRGN